MKLSTNISCQLKSRPGCFLFSFAIFQKVLEVVALEVPAVAQGVEALEVPVPAEAEEEVVVWEVIENNNFKACFNYFNLKCMSHAIHCHIVKIKLNYKETVCIKLRN